MSGKLPQITGRQMLGALRRDGWNVTSIKGSHHKLRHASKAGKITVPLHGNRDLDIHVV